MITWPHAGTAWAPRLAAVEHVYERLAVAITRFESLLVTCHDTAHRQHVRARLAAAGVPAGRARLAVAPCNDTWARDFGPVTVLEDGRPRLLDFTFNGWGGKFPAELDNGITGRLWRDGVFGPCARERVELVIEGGALETDGAGTLLLRERCLVSEARNPGLSRAALEARLGALLGARRCLWLSRGLLAGDDTDGHIDTLARFCDARTIAHVSCDDPDDPHFEELGAMTAELAELRDADGQPYRLVPLPLPAPRLGDDGERLPATHANFLVINGAVLVPVYDDPADAVALTRLGECFPGREIVPVPATPLIHEHGSLHCITMQLPAALAPDLAGGVEPPAGEAR